MDQPPSMPEVQPAQPSPASTSVWSHLMNVFAAPGEVFDLVRISGTSTANWLVPTLIYCLIATMPAVVKVSQPAIIQLEHEQRAKMFDNLVKAGRLTREQVDQRLAASESSSRPTVSIVVGGVGALFGGFAETFLWAFLLWLIGRVCLKSRFGFMKATEVAGLAGIIAALDALLKVLLIAITSNPLASPSLGLLVKDPSPTNKLFVLLSLVNPIIFWLLAVRSIGLAKLCGVSVTRAAAWVFSIWAVLIGTLVGIALAVQSILGM